jgi:hypothetical protein
VQDSVRPSLSTRAPYCTLGYTWPHTARLGTVNAHTVHLLAHSRCTHCITMTSRAARTPSQLAAPLDTHADVCARPLLARCVSPLALCVRLRALSTRPLYTPTVRPQRDATLCALTRFVCARSFRVAPRPPASQSSAPAHCNARALSLGAPTRRSARAHNPLRVRPPALARCVRPPALPAQRPRHIPFGSVNISTQMSNAMLYTRATN